MIDRQWLARSINNILQGSGLDPVDMAMVAQFQLADAKARQQAGETIIDIKQKTTLTLGVPDHCNATPGGYIGLARNQETSNGATTEG